MSWALWRMAALVAREAVGIPDRSAAGALSPAREGASVPPARPAWVVPAEPEEPSWTAARRARVE